MCNREREESVVEIISESNPHVGLLGSILVNGHARQIGNLGKVSFAVVAVKIVGLSIIGNKQVKKPVVVEV